MTDFKLWQNEYKENKLGKNAVRWAPLLFYIRLVAYYLGYVWNETLRTLSTMQSSTISLHCSDHGRITSSLKPKKKKKKKKNQTSAPPFWTELLDIRVSDRMRVNWEILRSVRITHAGSCSYIVLAPYLPLTCPYAPLMRPLHAPYAPLHALMHPLRAPYAPLRALMHPLCAPWRLLIG